MISIVPSASNNQTHILVHKTNLGYQYGYAEGEAEAQTIIQNPVIASIEAARLLGDRNQDLWGNVRFPAIESLEHGDVVSGWINSPEDNNLTYPSLVGAPVDALSSLGNTSFTLPASYLFVSCEVSRRPEQLEYTNFTAPEAPSPGNGHDCSWASSMGGSQYQLAISLPCPDFRSEQFNDGARAARRLIWESSLTYGECSLTTTFVDVNVTCTPSSSGGSSGSLCSTSAVRRSADPAFSSNWTVFDMDAPPVVSSVLQLLTGLFPLAQLSGGVAPVLTYLSDPFQAVGHYLDDTPVYTVGASTFQLRLAQLLNTILFIGINPPAFTGSFDSSNPDLGPDSSVNITAVTSIQGLVVKCNTSWLGVLLVASLGAFLLALFGALLRLATLAPNVLGSTSIVLLQNRIGAVAGISTWSSESWTREFWNLRIFVGDVEPQAQVGRIALATQGETVNPVKTERFYY